MGPAHRKLFGEGIFFLPPLSARSTVKLGGMSFARAERTRLRDLLLERGPEAPTLCEGWTTRDLAIHLWLRENRPDAVAGMFLRPLSAHTRAVSDAVRQRNYEDLVRDWGAGPGTWSVMRLPGVDRLANTAENFIHYEDVRRGPAWADKRKLPDARDLSRRVDDELARFLSLFARLLLRGSTRPVLLIAPDRRSIQCAPRRGVAEHGDEVVRVRGAVGELLLWTTGRDAAHVVVDNGQWLHRRQL